MNFDIITLPTDPQEEELHSLRTHFVNIYTSLADEFNSFRERAKELLTEADKALTDTVDTDPVTLQSTLLNNMALHYSLGQSVVDAKSYQQIYDILHYCPKKQKYSESDRKLYVATKTIKQSNLVSHLRNAEDKMEKRITVLQSVLKAEMIRMQNQESAHA